MTSQVSAAVTTAPRPRAGRWWTRLTALAAAVVALVAAASPAAAAVPSNFVGIQGWGEPTVSDLERLDRANVHSYRTLLKWSAVEARRGHYDWSGYDRLFLKAARANVRLLPVLLGSPRWAARREPYPPTSRTNRQAFYRFVSAAAARYGPNGGFWETNPVARSVRPRYWQVWNEPDLGNYWNGNVNPQDYGRFLISTSSAAKGADRDVRIVSAGLTNGNCLRRWCTRSFLRAMMQVPGAGDAFDALGLHTYAANSTWRTDIPTRLSQARRALDAYWETQGKPIMVTEFGWSTATQSRFTTTPDGQAYRLRYAYRQLLGNSRVIGAYWFGYRDPPLNGRRDRWQFHTGLFTRRDRPKPAWYSLLRVTGGQP